VASLGHSDCIHFKNPGIKTNSVEEFIAAAKAAGTVAVVHCAKEYEDQQVEWMSMERRAGLPEEEVTED
jgi:hypothetical protein